MLNAGYFRHPTISGDTVAFVSEDDLWSVPASGGLARRLTAGAGDAFKPALSLDGATLAFTSREEHHAEVWSMPAEGGQPRRLTYLGANSVVVGWSPRGEIVFRSDTAQPFMRINELYAVSPEGGQPRALNLGLAHEIAFGPGDAVALGRNTLDPARWKRYRGGTAGHLWVDARGKGTFKRLDLPGNVAHPMWIGKRMYFVADHEGIGNVYSCRPDGSDLRRHTDHGEYYARFASSDGRRIVYQHAAEIWLLDPAEDAPRRIEIEFPSPRTQRNRRFVDAAQYGHGYAVHPDGRAIAYDARGKPFTMPLWEGAVRELGKPAGTRYRLGQWLADAERVVATTDETGEETLEVFDAGGGSRRLDLDFGRAVEMLANPKRNVVAIANHRLELHLIDCDTGTAKVLDRSRFHQIGDLAWSPDGAWLAYVFAETNNTYSIKICEIATGKTHAVTRPDFRDYSPSWDPEGKYLLFLSYRTFDPVYDVHFFDLGFPMGAKPYLIALQKDTPNPFIAEPKGFGDDKSDEKDPGKKGPGKEEPGKKEAAAEELRVRIDLDGIEQRIAMFPMPEKRYQQVWAIKGKALFTSVPVSGSLGMNWREQDEEARGSLEVFDFGELRHEVIQSGVSDFLVSADGSTLVYRAGRRLRALRAGERPDASYEKDPPSRKSGWLDLGRIRVSVDPAAEWRQMYAEAWRLQRDNFWTEDMSGVDWERVRERYRPLVEKVATRWEFSDLMWEMQGELGTSHAYEFGGDYRQPPRYPIGYLGADLVLDEKAGGYRIERIVRGDPWDESSHSPLAGIGANVAEGEVITAINGRSLSKDTPPQAVLVNQAGQAVELRIGGKRAKKPRAVTVKTLSSETPARYREWVEANRALVHEATGGRIGYVHVPNMGPEGYSEFHRYYLSEIDREGLVVDVRFNGGGHVSQIILEKLARKRVGYDAQRWGAPEPYPSDSVLGPMVCITNEHAGSDGDIFTHVFKLLKLGPVVGKRTWGGVIGIWPRHVLADNSITTQPEMSFWFVDVGWGVENYGTDPDVDVDIAPQDHAAGRDPQMDKALELIRRELKRNPPKLPDFSKRPRLPLPKLPRRR